jgi:hypothetical protein
MNRADLMRYAEVGARAEYDRLRNELATLLGTFPALARQPLAPVDNQAIETAADRPRRTRPPFTAAQRKAQSRRMKAMWAAKKAATR